MARTESIIPQAPTGAARKRDYTWPDPNNNISGVPSSLFRDRTGMSSTASGGQSNGTSGALAMGVVNGVDCVRMTNGVNIGGGPVITLDAGRVRVNLLSSNLSFTTATDDYGVYRIYAIMRVTATPVQATDVGFQLTNSGNIGNGIFTSAMPGFAINYDNTGTMSLVVRGDNGAFTSFQISPNVAAGFLNTDWHMGELRLIGAQPGVNASIKTFFDGQLRNTQSWPNNLPSPAGVGGSTNNGFASSIHQNAQNAELDVALVRMQYAPTEADLF
jgi:hypothetical protein